MKQEAEQAAIAKRAAEAQAKQQEVAAKALMMQGNGMVEQKPGSVMDGVRQDSMVSADGVGDGLDSNGRTSGRAKPKKDYSTLHRGNSIASNKAGIMPGKPGMASAGGSAPGLSKANSTSAK